MSARSLPELVALNMRVPRGNDAFWREIRRLDVAGPWTVADVVGLTNVTTRTVSQFVESLREAGYAAVVDVQPHYRGARPKNVYRLLKRPVPTPRFDRRGRELPETQIETLWRTMKMAKTFTRSELVTYASNEGREINKSTARNYVSELSRVGILAKMSPGGPCLEARFRLVRNLGVQAPKVLTARVVFDPNVNAMVGEAEGREVTP